MEAVPPNETNSPMSSERGSGHATPLSPDELNRLWQHGLHEERLFHDRLNYFSVLEMGLLSGFAILYNKDRPLGLLVTLAVAALLFTLFWLLLQHNHWHYCVHVYARIREHVPEYRRTIETYDGPGAGATGASAFTFNRSLALAAPILFALTWIAFLAWTLGNSPNAPR